MYINAFYEYNIKHSVMKTYEAADVESIFSWPLYYLEVNDQLYAPATLPPRKEHQLRAV
jgi:hypothetical protein